MTFIITRKAEDVEDLAVRNADRYALAEALRALACRSRGLPAEEAQTAGSIAEASARRDEGNQIERFSAVAKAGGF